MSLKDNFWKEASRQIEDLLINPIKLKNEDLLIEGLQDYGPSNLISISRSRLITKTSSFNSRYKNYKPLFMTVLKNSDRFSVLSRKHFETTPSPINLYKRHLVSDYQRAKYSSNCLEVNGRKAAVSFLPRIIPPGKIKVASKF
jgi:hypothetical protein